MSQTFSYSPGPFNIGQLSDELVAASIDLEFIAGNPAAVDIVVGDAVLQAAVDAVVSAHVPDNRLPWEKEVDAHEAASDPHPTYLTSAEAGAAYEPTGAAAAAVASHEAAADPHAGYQKESEKGAANGYASLDAGAKVPSAQLASGTADATTFLRGDGAWAAPAGMSDGDKGDITVGGGGTTMTIDAGVVDTTNLGGDITTAGKALLDDADAAAQRATLGLGTAATANTSAFEAAGAVTAGINAHTAASDPHPVYLTAAEGNAAYEPIGAAASAVSTHAAAADPHPGYLTPAEGNAAYEPLGAASVAVNNHAAAADPHTGYQKESEKGSANGYAGLDSGSKVATANLGSGTANSTTFLRGDQSWASTDPWTIVKLTSDVTINGTSMSNVTGLSFTPAANTEYMVEMRFLVRSNNTGGGCRLGCTWPTGLTDGSAYFSQPIALTGTGAYTYAVTAGTASGNTLGTAIPSTTASYMARGHAIIRAGASPSGNFQVQASSSTLGSHTATVKAGSFIRYRSY